MEAYTYKGISAGKYIEGEIEALNQDEASHLSLIHISEPTRPY